MASHVSPRNFRRLLAAEGYLQLGMAQQALEELDAVEDAGPFEAPLQFMRGEALRAQERYDDAIRPLQRAAKLIPAPHNKQAWLALGDCFRQGGQDALAEVVELIAQTPPVKPVLNINITIQKPPTRNGNSEPSDE